MPVGGVVPRIQRCQLLLKARLQRHHVVVGALAVRVFKVSSLIVDGIVGPTWYAASEKLLAATCCSRASWETPAQRGSTATATWSWGMSQHAGVPALLMTKCHVCHHGGGCW